MRNIQYIMINDKFNKSKYYKTPLSVIDFSTTKNLKEDFELKFSFIGDY